MPKREFVVDYIFKVIKSGAIYEDKYLLGTSFARPLIAKKLVEIAHKEGAKYICHGCTGKGNDQVRFELGITAFAPEIKVIAPWRIWDIQSREDAIDYATTKGVSVDTVLVCLEVMTGMLSTMRVNQENMLQAVKKGFLNATEVADYLVGKGVPFRDAHRIVGEIVLFCEKKGLAIEELELEEFRQYSDLFQEDVFAWIAYEQVLERGIKELM